jgi:hypothetical protein
LLQAFEPVPPSSPSPQFASASFSKPENFKGPQEEEE